MLPEIAVHQDCQKRSHLTEIDGLRAVAVLSVVLYHSGLDWFRGGYFGVDIFFVISGYVITRRVSRDLRFDRYSVVEFYRRRLRRILPATMLTLVATTYMAHLWLLPADYVSYSHTLKSVLTINANQYLATQTNYFQPETDFMPLAHLWSLAIEEQFYLVFPLVVVLSKSRDRLAALLAIATVFSMIWMLKSMSSDSASYFSTFNRIGQISVGGVCALRDERCTEKSGEFQFGKALNIFSLAVIMSLIPLFTMNQAVPSAWSFLPVGLSAVFLMSPRSDMTVRVLSWRPLQLIGLSSFSIYLLHQPLMAFARTVIYGTPYSFPSTFEKVSMCATSVVFGLCCWHLVEEPIRQSRARREAAAVVVMLVVGFYLFDHANNVIESQGLANRIPTEFAESIRRREEAMSSNGFQVSNQCAYSVTLRELPTLAMTKRFTSCRDQFGPPLLVAGDSHAQDLHNALAFNLADRFILGIYRNELTHAQFIAELSSQLHTNELRPHAVLFTLEASTWIEDNQIQIATLTNDTAAILSAAQQIAESSEFVWLGPQLEPRIDLLSANPLVGRIREQNTIRLSEKLSRSVDDELHELTEAAGLQYLSKLEIVDFDYSRDFELEQGFTYSDRTHWSTLGEKVFGARLVASPLLKSVLN